MAEADPSILQELMQRGQLWKGQVSASFQRQVMPSGFAELDQALGGGWPQAGLVEVFAPVGVGLSLLLPLFAHLSQQSKFMIWVLPPFVPYAPALQRQGVDLNRLLLLSPNDLQQALWAAEQSLGSGRCALLLLWADPVTSRQMRRLQLAAEAGDALAILFRPEKARRRASVAAWRLALRPDAEGLQVEILKCKGGWGARTLRLPCCG